MSILQEIPYIFVHFMLLVFNNTIRYKVKFIMPKDKS